MKLRSGAPLWVAIARAFAQDEVYGPVGANNASTPIVREGGVTIHCVTVGKIEHVFQVNNTQSRTLLDLMITDLYAAKQHRC